MQFNMRPRRRKHPERRCFRTRPPPRLSRSARRTRVRRSTEDMPCSRPATPASLARRATAALRGIARMTRRAPAALAERGSGFPRGVTALAVRETGASRGVAPLEEHARMTRRGVSAPSARVSMIRRRVTALAEHVWRCCRGVTALAKHARNSSRAVSAPADRETKEPRALGTLEAQVDEISPALRKPPVWRPTDLAGPERLRPRKKRDPVPLAPVRRQSLAGSERR